MENSINTNSDVKGTIIGGSHNRILIRQKHGKQIEIGELLVVEDVSGQKILLQVYDLMYGSQLSQPNLELVSGMRLEQGSGLEFMEKELRNYTLVVAKNLMALDTNRISRSLPQFFSDVRALAEHDLSFISTPMNPLFLGNLRSGSRMINVDLCLDGEKVLAEHILIAASTGKGKSNLTSCLLWSVLDMDYCGMLVLDPHDEYFGRNKLGLKDHPKKERVVYYSKNPVPGARTLKINLRRIKPAHLNGVISLTDAQHEALVAYNRAYKNEWIEAILKELPVEGFQGITIAVVKRKLMGLLDLRVMGENIGCSGIFDNVAGETTPGDIADDLEQGKTVIIDTSNLSSSVEILTGSLIANDLFSRYKRYKTDGVLARKPQISVIIEEAPRVLGKDALEAGPNIFSTIAREGRKFKVGIIAITQLPSLIPRQILANMNTKIIMGMEMGLERRAIIESASQDLADDDKNIASLDKGEAIVTSNFVRFATPIKIPLFEKYAAEQRLKINGTTNDPDAGSSARLSFAGINMH